MLRQRIVTAVVLLALLLPALIVDKVWPFAWLSMVVFAAGGWEWARLNDAEAYAAPLGIGLGTPEFMEHDGALDPFDPHLAEPSAGELWGKLFTGRAGDQ